MSQSVWVDPQVVDLGFSDGDASGLLGKRVIGISVSTTYITIRFHDGSELEVSLEINGWLRYRLEVA